MNRASLIIAAAAMAPVWVHAGLTSISVANPSMSALPRALTFAWGYILRDVN